MRYPEIPSFREAVRWALADKATRRQTRYVLEQWDDARQEGMARWGDDLRIAIKAIRSQTINQWKHLTQTFQTAANQHGVITHFAPTAKDAASLIQLITERSTNKEVVAPWAPILDEIHAEEAVQRGGGHITYVDVGGYVLQQGRERPAHPVHLLAHLTTRDIGLLLAERWDQEPRFEVSFLARQITARTRHALMKADIGLVGGTFAVAETGHIVLLDPEGARVMAATLPRKVIVVLGLESIVPTWRDVSLLSRAFWLGATGEDTVPLAVALPGPEEGEDAPEEFHVILVDNGRQRMGDSAYREALYCLHCGACATACPLFREVGGQVYGGPHMGPVGAVWAAFLRPDEFKDLPFASTLCGACAAACPVGIDIPGLLARLRKDWKEKGRMWYWGRGRI